MLKATKTTRNVPSTGTSAKSPIVTGIASPPGFARSRSTMRSEASMPCDLDPTGGERERDPTAADRELEHAPVAGQLGEELDRARGIELRVPLVVDVSDPVAVGRRLVSLHGPRLSSLRAPID